MGIPPDERQLSPVAVAVDAQVRLDRRPPAAALGLHFGEDRIQVKEF